MTKHRGMTLVEILIALAIMVVIATFIIPKVLDRVSGANSDEEKWQRIVKQNASIISAAYGQYRLNNRIVPSTFEMTDLTPYFNYIAVDSTSQIDGTPCWGTPISCSAAWAGCYKMQNGSIMLLNKNESFGGTSNLNVLYAMTDPDGKVTGPAGQQPGKGVGIWLHYTGRQKARAELDAGTYNSGGVMGPAACDPSWWNWN